MLFITTIFISIYYNYLFITITIILYSCTHIYITYYFSNYLLHSNIILINYYYTSITQLLQIYYCKFIIALLLHYSVLLLCYCCSIFIGSVCNNYFPLHLEISYLCKMSYCFSNIFWRVGNSSHSYVQDLIAPQQIKVVFLKYKH